MKTFTKNYLRTMLAFIMLIVFTTASIAQNAIAPQNERKNKNRNELQTVKTHSQWKYQKKDITELPYYNYKGISDLDKAKAAWIADHPEDYAAMKKNKNVRNKTIVPKPAIENKNPGLLSNKINNNPSNKINAEDKMVKPITTKDPNANRRLPKDYDDSKTNKTKKN
jgi:hypothetical protein